MFSQLYDSLLNVGTSFLFIEKQLTTDFQNQLKLFKKNILQIKRTDLFSKAVREFVM